MVVGKIRRIFKTTLSIAMAASIMATSIPQFSVTAMAQEVGMNVQENTTEQNPTEVAEADETEEDETEEGKAQDENVSDETEGENADAPDEDSKMEDEGADQEDESDGKGDDEKDKKDQKEDKPSVNKKDTKVQADTEEDVEGKIIYENYFNSEEAGTELAKGSVVKLADGNMAIEYDVDLSDSKGEWKDIFQADLSLSPAYTDVITEKMCMSFDVYFPDVVDDSTGDSETDEGDSTNEIGKMAAKAVLKVGSEYAWTESSKNVLLDLGESDLVTDEIEGYSKFHVVLDMNSETGWDVADITSIQSVVPCLAGNGSTYKGKLYLDNVVLKDTSSDDPGNEEPEEPTDEEDIYTNDFDAVEKLEDVVNMSSSEFGDVSKDEDGKALVELAQLADGNKAIKITADLSGTSAWADIFKMEIDLKEEYAKTIRDKVVMSYDLYFPESSAGDDFGTMTAMGGLKSGTSWTWVTGKQGSDYATAQWAANSDVAGYKVFHVEINMNDFKTWNSAASKDEDYPFADITPIKAVIPCLAGNTSKYKGDIYLDNLKVKAVGVTDGDDKPGEEDPIEGDLIYKNNFDSLESLEKILAENVTGASPTLATLVGENKAVKYSVNLSGSGWDDIFKAQFNLATPYEKEITEKVVMSYDVYFPADKVGEGFDSMKAQAALSCGSSWTWASAKSIPELKTTDLVEDASVPGYKKVHVEIDMTDFETWDNEAGANKPYAFEDITPIQAVIPCFAGSGSTYEGDLYLDNLEVWAVNESGSDIPEPTEDLFLELDESAWTVSEDAYQYTGESKIGNKTIGGKKYLVATMDYSNDKSQSWSEAKFEYTHPDPVDTLQGYNAFKADIYYKPAAGSFAIKLFANSPKIDSNAALPAGEPANIPGLEGYYKAEFVLNNRFPSGTFQNLTFGFVGQNTDFVGDVYLDNMRFTKVDAEDVYVDSTILPKKGAGIQVVDAGRSIQTASGKKVAIAEEVAMVDAKAIDATKNLYAYLKAVGESDSVIFGHQNDTHHKAGSKGDEFANSDTKDLTGSIAGVVGIDTLSLTGNEASAWDAPEAERIAEVAEITREAAVEGAIITLSAHMPNFEVIDQRVKNFEASGGTTSETLGYWKAADGSKQYNFSGYTPGTTSGNIVSRIMPGQDLNYLYTDYLDLIADYAKAVEGDGITILFRPLHENTGSWFWWGAAFCDEQAYINLYRYTVDYLKETRNVHNIIYVYGPGSEAANVSEYSARYPGDAYVDMIGYDLYHSNPSQENEAGYLQSIKKQNTILRDFATAHNKLYAITETGVADKNAAGKDIALQLTGNKVMDWYMQLLDEIGDDGVSYFLVWANFGSNEGESFYLPYAVEKKDDGYLHGHEMMDEFIKFYNDGRSVFATDMNSEYKKVSGVTNTTQENDVSGYFIAPQSGDRILPDEKDPKTRIAAKVSGVDLEAEDLSVQFVVSTEFDEVILQATYNEREAVWEADLKDSALISMGEAMGTITLLVNSAKISEITARFNMVEAVQDNMAPEDFEGYNGNSQQLGLAWATNKASGSEINLSLINDSEKVFGGDYGLQMDITLAASDAYAGATKSLNADWSKGNALEFYTIPESNGQKIVVQVTTAGNQVFEVYLQEFDDYTTNAANGFPVKVTIPFSAFVGRDSKDAKLDPSKIESIGLWCNAIAKEGVEFPLSTTLYYDEFKVVTTDKTAVDFAPTAYKGIWFKEIPAQTYTGKAIKPDVQVYDDAKLLTPKKDYTVSYKNNTKAGPADVIIKGKGNYSETITGHFTIQPKKIAELTITAPEYIIYNGKEQNIAVTVKDGKKKLGTKNDYTQVITFDDGSEQGQAAEVQKAKEEGTYKIKITMKGNYDGETELTCKVVKDKDLLSKAAVTIPKSLDYDDGKEVKFEEPQIVVKLKGKVIPQEEEDGTVNYAVSYEDNRQVGTACVVITAGTDSKYVGSVRKTFTIKGKTFSTKTIDITGFETKRPYTGKSVYQSPVLRDKTSESDALLEKNEDYRITYAKNVNAGTATMTITGLGKYSGTIKKNFTIEKVTLTENMVQSQIITVKQNRAGATPDVELIYEGRRLVKDRDYKLTYTGNKNTTSENKQAWINIAGKGNFKGSLKKAVELKIEPKSWSSGEITVDVPDMKYSSKKAQYTPDPVVYDNGKKLTKNKDYTVAYESNTKEDIGEITDEWQSHEAKVIITLSGSDYVVGEAGEEKKFSFRITGKLISEAKVTIDPQKKQFFSQYGTKLEKSDLTVTYKGNPIGEGEYDIISYSKNDKKGKATLVLAGKGEYGGTKTVTFTINARGMESNLAEELKNKLEEALTETTVFIMEAFE